MSIINCPNLRTACTSILAWITNSTYTKRKPHQKWRSVLNKKQQTKGVPIRQGLLYFEDLILCGVSLFFRNILMPGQSWSWSYFASDLPIYSVRKIYILPQAFVIWRKQTEKWAIPTCRFFFWRFVTDSHLKLRPCLDAKFFWILLL